MKTISKLSKTFLYISALSCAIWVGAYVTRLLMVYNIYEFDGINLFLRPFYNNNLHHVLNSFLPLFSTTLVLYPVFIITFVLFLISSRLNLRRNGWLFMITVLVFITMPFEIYLMTFDYRIFNTIYYNSGFDINTAFDLITKRIQILNTFPIIEVLCYCSILFLAIFRPFTKGLKITEQAIHEN